MEAKSLEQQLNEILKKLKKEGPNLSDLERRSICSLGSSRKAFVCKLLEIAERKGDDLAIGTVSCDKLEAMFELTQYYEHLEALAAEIHKQIGDVYLIMGNQTFKEARALLKKVEGESHQDESVKERFIHLNAFFRKTKKRKNKY